MNRPDSGLFCTESLEFAAKQYKTLGFSILPLHGARHPQQPKLPAIKWGRLQKVIAPDKDIEYWFRDQRFLGIGIVCGQVSRLIVVDFDDASEASEFRRQNPTLSNTLTVRSGLRELPHFYFRIPANLIVPTASYGKVDLRAEGAYVVAPPTRVGQACWAVENNTPPRELSAAEVRHLLGYLAGRKVPGKAANEEIYRHPSRDASEFRRQIDAERVVELYRSKASQGRNEALFAAAVLARDGGLSGAETTACLADVHAVQQGAVNEPYEVRFAEALRTIGSVFSRPARGKPSDSGSGLSNGAREALLEKGLTALARVLDGLYLAKVSAGELMTEAQIGAVLKPFAVGRRSILSALGATIDEHAVFAAVQSPLIPPEDANAAKQSEDLNHSCFMSRGAKRDKNGRGRPARHYLIPPPEAVHRLLGIAEKPADPMAASDLASPRAYRQSLHREMLQRRPGHYPRAWLAQRIGVSRWTLRRYEAASGLYVQPAFVEKRLTWSLAETLPRTRHELGYGIFIEDGEGTRFPAIRSLAFKLLKQGRAVFLKHQHTNFYSARPFGVGIPTPATPKPNMYSSIMLTAEPVLPAKTSQGIWAAPPATTGKGLSQMAAAAVSTERSTTQAKANTFAAPLNSHSVGIPTPEAELRFWLCPACLNFHIRREMPEGCTRCGFSGVWERIPPTIWQDAGKLHEWWKARYQAHHLATSQSQALPTHSRTQLSGDIRALVERMRTHVKGLSFSNARKLVEQFGAALVEQGLQIIQQRERIHSPAGFLVSLLRSNNKLNNNKSLVYGRARAETESPTEWLRRLAQSEYRSFIANLDQLLGGTEMAPAAAQS